MSEHDMEEVAKKLAEIRHIIVDREGEDVQDQFEVGSYIFIVNIDGSGYAEDEDVFTLIQVEKGPMGMEQLVACAVEENLQNDDGEPERYVICGDDKNILDELNAAHETAYRHWHWLDLPNMLPGSEFEEDELDDDEDFE